MLVVDYFRPEADGGEAKMNPCVAVPDRIEFSLEGVKATVGIGRFADSSFIEVWFKVPAGTLVQLARRDLLVLRTEHDRPSLTTFIGISEAQNPFLPAKDIEGPMIGAVMRVGSMVYDKNYWLYAPLETSGTDGFRVVLPPYAVNERSVRLPEIRFSRETRVRHFVGQC